MSPCAAHRLLRRLLPVAAAVTLAGAAALPASASTTITSPADGTLAIDDLATPTPVAVSGTATPETSVDLRCSWRASGTTHVSAVLSGGSAVPVSGGAFTASVTLPDDTELCRLVALPSGQPVPSDLSGYAGPRLSLLLADHLPADTKATPPGSQHDFGATAIGTDAEAWLDAAGSYGLDATHLLTPEPARAGRVFGLSDTILATDPATGGDPQTTATGMVVDGINTYNGSTWESVLNSPSAWLYSGFHPFPAVSDAVALKAGPSAELTEEDTIVRCTGGTNDNYYPPQGNTCGGLADAGVRLEVVSSTGPAGTVLTRRWRFASTDGQAHHVRFVVRETAYDNGNGHPRTWRLPGDAGYVAHTSGQLPAPPAAAPWALRFHAEGAADGDVSEGVGGLVSSAVPSAMRFTADKVIALTYDLDVPAGGATDVVHAFASEATQAALDADLAAAIARLSPSPEPAPGPSGGGGGGATDGTGGGSPSGGSPSGGGQPPAGGGAGAPRRPVLVRRGRPRLRAGRLQLGLAGRCPGAGPACRFTLRVVTAAAPRRRSKVVLGPVAVTVRATRTTALAVKVPKGRRAAIAMGHLRLRALLQRSGAATARVDRPLPLARRR